jgi:indolepyruvate ferredoxin oxidoreductase beta subunit
VTSSNPYSNISDYPDPEDIYSEIRKIRNHLIIDAEAIARDIGSVRAANIVMLGAASPYIDIPYGSLENAIRTLFGKKGAEIVDLNLKALKAGKDCVS